MSPIKPREPAGDPAEEPKNVRPDATPAPEREPEPEPAPELIKWADQILGEDAHTPKAASWTIWEKVFFARVAWVGDMLMKTGRLEVDEIKRQLQITQEEAQSLFNMAEEEALDAISEGDKFTVESTKSKRGSSLVLNKPPYPDDEVLQPPTISKPDTAPTSPETAVDVEKLRAAIPVVLDPTKGPTKKILQKELGISSDEAGAILDELELLGIIDRLQPGKKRQVIITSLEAANAIVDRSENKEDDMDKEPNDEDTRDEDYDENKEPADEGDEDGDDESDRSHTTHTTDTPEPNAEPDPKPEPEPDADADTEPDTEPNAKPDTENKPPPETEREPPPEPTAKKTSIFTGIASRFRGSYERFVSKFKGEVQPEV